MKIPLQTWYDTWLKEHEKTNLVYAKYNNEVQLKQVHFVRDALSSLVWHDVSYDKRQSEPEQPAYKVTAYVIGEHKSKSVRLPVYSLERPDLEIQMVLRYNFYNWNVSVISEKPVKSGRLWGFVTNCSGFRFKEDRAYQPGDSWGYCFFEGFPSEFRLGPYVLNQSRFSLWVDDDYEMYSLVRNIMISPKPTINQTINQ